MPFAPSGELDVAGLLGCGAGVAAGKLPRSASRMEKCPSLILKLLRSTATSEPRRPAVVCPTSWFAQMGVARSSRRQACLPRGARCRRVDHTVEHAGVTPHHALCGRVRANPFERESGPEQRTILPFSEIDLRHSEPLKRYHAPTAPTGDRVGRCSRQTLPCFHETSKMTSEIAVSGGGLDCFLASIGRACSVLRQAPVRKGQKERPEEAPYVSRLSHSSPRTQRRAESLPLIIPHS
jgi:hypothetical protein